MDGHPETIFDHLDREWARLVASGALDLAVARWGRRDARLRSFQGIRPLFDHLRYREVDPDEHSEVLLGLLTTAREDRLAARVVLQRFVPGLKRIAAWGHPFTQVEWDGHVVAEAFEVIATYPIERRPSKVAANIMMDVRKRLYALLSEYRTSQAELTHQPIHPEAVAPDPFDPIEAAQLIDSSRRRVGLPADAAQLILLTRVLGFSVMEIAQRVGVPSARLRKRRWGAEQRIREVLPRA